MEDKNYYSIRASKLLEKITQKKIDAAIILTRPNTFYFSGFRGTSSIIILSKNQNYFFTDSRYYFDVKKSFKKFKVELITYEKSDFIKNFSSKQNFFKIGYEDSITVSEFRLLKTLFPKAKWTNISSEIAKIRMIKDKTEINNIEKAAQVTDIIFSDVLKIIKPGIREIDIAYYIKRKADDFRCEEESFKSIIASGINSACPHAHPTARKIRKGDFLTLDFGVKINGYCSDMTRTVVIGKASKKHKDIYNIVLEAQMKAAENIKPGVKTKNIDKIARDIITEYSYGQNFLHGTGHSLGIDIHEPPRLNKLDKSVLQEGMVVTVEPGIYIEGWGGVRIEDMVLVTETGGKILSKSDKKLIEII